MSEDKIAASFAEKHKEKIFVITHPLCPACQAVEEALKDEIKSGKIEKIEITSDEDARTFMKVMKRELGIDTVPSFFAVDDDKDALKVCYIDITRKESEMKCVKIKRPESEG